MAQKLNHFFFPGAFEVGDGSLYPGINLVKRSVALGEPIIYVSANYRGNGVQKP